MLILQKPSDHFYTFYQCYCKDNKFNEVKCEKIDVDGEYVYQDSSKIIIVEKFLPEFMHKFILKQRLKTFLKVSL
jgi:hypothetical protein